MMVQSAAYNIFWDMKVWFEKNIVEYNMIVHASPQTLIHSWMIFTMFSSKFNSWLDVSVSRTKSMINIDVIL